MCRKFVLSQQLDPDAPEHTSGGSGMLQERGHTNLNQLEVRGHLGKGLSLLAVLGHNAGEALLSLRLSPEQWQTLPPLTQQDTSPRCCALQGGVLCATPGFHILQGNGIIRLPCREAIKHTTIRLGPRAEM